MNKYKIISLIMAAALCVGTAGCAAKNNTDTVSSGQAAAVQNAETPAGAQSAETTAAASETGKTTGSASVSADSEAAADGSEFFTDRDLAQTADLTGAKQIEAEDGKTVQITEAGVYVLSGEASDFTVRVSVSNEDKVQLVLDSLTVTNESAPVIYVESADKVFVTTAEGTSSLSVTGEFEADGDTNLDAVIFSKDDITLNGTGTLSIDSTGHGVAGKDDVKVTGGAYVIKAAGHGIEANDSIALGGGSLTVTAGKDGLHAENDEDDSLGWIYVSEAALSVNAGSDALHAVSFLRIDSGRVTAKAGEGMEATYIQINGGTVDITATDDGVNAGAKSSAYPVLIEINDGDITVDVGQGDTDAIDSNGDITVNGGTIHITSGMSSFDYDGAATYNGGTIIINGETVNAIPQSMMGGGMGGMGRGGMGNMPEGGMGRGSKNSGGMGGMFPGGGSEQNATA